jgi:hypothetical protein
MKDRIERDGVWYVREDQTKQQDVEFDFISFDGRVYESGLYCFEVTKLHKDDGTLYPGCSIEFTDKRVKPFKNEFWDNENWFLGVLNKDPVSIKSLEVTCCEQGVKEFEYVLNDLVKVGWLNKD